MSALVRLSMRSITLHTVQVAVAHLVRHVSDEQSLAGGNRSTITVGLSALSSNSALAPHVVLNDHTSALELGLIELLYRPVRVILRGELDVSKALAHTSRIRDDSTSCNFTKAGELGLESSSGGLEEEVADVEDFARGSAGLLELSSTVLTISRISLNGLRSAGNGVLSSVDGAFHPALALGDNFRCGLGDGCRLAVSGVGDFGGGDALLLDVRLLRWARL